GAARAGHNRATVSLRARAEPEDRPQAEDNADAAIRHANAGAAAAPRSLGARGRAPLGALGLKMLPIRDDNSHFVTPYVTYGLIAANIAVWVFLQGLGADPALAR